MNKLGIYFLTSLLVTMAWAEKFEVDTLKYSGAISQHINIVNLGDGYLESELDDFSKDAVNMMDLFFDSVPFSNYTSYFNVFAIKIPSNVRVLRFQKVN